MGIVVLTVATIVLLVGFNFTLVTSVTEIKAYKRGDKASWKLSAVVDRVLSACYLAYNEFTIALIVYCLLNR